MRARVADGARTRGFPIHDLTDHDSKARSPKDLESPPPNGCTNGCIPNSDLARLAADLKARLSPEQFRRLVTLLEPGPPNRRRAKSGD